MFLRTVEKIFFPTGGSNIFCRNDDETWKDVVEKKVLPMWEEYCNTHWISENHEDIYAAEKRVKAFLDRCGYILLQDDPGDVESKHKEMVRRVREFPISDCPSSMSELLYSSVRTPDEESEAVAESRFGVALNEKEEAVPITKRPKRSTKKYEKMRYDKLTELRNKFPNGRFSWARVWTDNTFTSEEHVFQINKALPQYKPKKTREGMYYEMDSVFIIWNDDGVHLYDQNVDEIKPTDFWVTGYAAVA